MGKSRYTLRVDKKKLEKWREVVDNSEEYASLRHLISLSVHRNISEDWVHKSQFDGLDVSGSIDDDVLDEMREKLGELVTKVEMQSLDDSGSEEIQDLSKTFYSYIPRVHPDDLQEWMQTTLEGVTLTPEERLRTLGRFDDFTQYFGDDVDEWTIRQALGRCEADITHVESGSDAEQQLRYYALDKGATRVDDIIDEDNVPEEEIAFKTLREGDDEE